MSDCHYDEGVPYVRERFRRALETVYAYADGQGYQGLDALYVNGDFTNRSTRTQMELFHKDVMACLRFENTDVENAIEKIRKHGSRKHYVKTCVCRTKRIKRKIRINM